MEPKTPVSPALAGRFFTTRATWGALDCMKVKDSQSCLTLCNPTDYTVHGILQARILEWVAFPYSRGSSQPRDQTQVSHIADGFFTSWATGKPKNTGVGSLFLLQGIFPTQKSNLGLLHCSRNLYQLSYQGSLDYMGIYNCQDPYNCTLCLLF